MRGQYPEFAAAIIAGCVAAALAATIGIASAGTKKFSVLYAFCQKANCADGALPNGPLVMDKAANLYGTTFYGGSTNCFDGCGTVFRLAPDGTETVLYAFCSKDTSCPDGEYPDSPLLIDSSGNLYGTTAVGGTGQDGGTIFRLAPDGTETVLYSFCSRADCTDGEEPQGRVIMDRRGQLYGTTVGGGTSQDGGTVFEVTQDGKEKILYSFCSQSGCTDGYNPDGGVVRDGAGNLYGTTLNGGSNARNCSIFQSGICGTVFKIDSTGAETVLYSFCASGGCPDGAGPYAGVVLDKNGNLYGTTAAGGRLDASCPNVVDDRYCGVVFELQPNSTETVLYAFCGQSNCADGALPLAGVTLQQNKSGITLYGTAEGGGGAQGDGVVYRLSSGIEKVLHAFCSRTNCNDGAVPQSGLIKEGGSVVGTTLVGGKNGAGTIYRHD